MAEDEKIEKLQAQIIDVLNLQKELKEQQDKFKKDYDKEMGDYINKIDELKEDLDKNAVFTTPEEYEGIKQEISELKEAVKLTHPTAIKLLSGDVRNIEKLLRDFHKEFHDIISIIAKDEWDSDTSANLRTHRDRIKRIFNKLDAKDSIHNDPIIKKAQEKFQEIKDGSKSADSGGILGGAKKKRNIDLKVDEQPSELYELYMKDKGQYYFKKTTHPFTQFNNMVNLGMGEMRVLRADLEKMILELRNNIYGFDKEEWFTNIEKQIGYDYKKDLKRILEERKHIRDDKKE